MTRQDRADPSRLHVRRDPGVDPPSIEFALDLEHAMSEGDVMLFVDDEADPARVFELHRTGGAFRISDQLGPPRGTFASAQVAIRAGWAAVDAGTLGRSGDLPPIGALLDKPDPTGGAA